MNIPLKTGILSLSFLFFNLTQCMDLGLCDASFETDRGNRTPAFLDPPVYEDPPQEIAAVPDDSVAENPSDLELRDDTPDPAISTN